MALDRKRAHDFLCKRFYNDGIDPVVAYKAREIVINLASNIILGTDEDVRKFLEERYKEYLDIKETNDAIQDPQRSD